MSDLTLTESTIQIGNKEFKIIHNMPDVPGLCIEDALVNWSVRTDKYTPESFCEYVNSKNTGFICMTEKAFEKLKNEDY